MKKTLILLLLILFTSLQPRSNPTSVGDSSNDTLLMIYLHNQDTLFKLINGVTQTFEESSKRLHDAILFEASRSDSIYRVLQLINSNSNQWNSKLNNSLKSGLTEVSNKIPDPQSGLSSILGSIIGAVLSGAFAIWVFVQGKRNAKKKEEKMLFNYGEEIYTLVKNITVNSRMQVELLKKLVESIKTNPHKHGVFQHISFNLLKRAQSFDTTRVFNTFQSLNLEKRSYIKYYNSIDFLLEEFTNIDYDYHKNNNDVITPLSNDFIKIRQAIFSKGTDYIELKRRESETDDPLCQFLNALIIKYYKSPQYPKTVDIKYDFDMLIKPLKPELIEKYRDNDYANVILDLAKQAGDLFVSITQINVEFSSNVEEQIGNIYDMIEKLERIEGELRTKYAS